MVDATTKRHISSRGSTQQKIDSSCSVFNPSSNRVGNDIPTYYLSRCGNIELKEEIKEEN